MGGQSHSIDSGKQAENHTEVSEKASASNSLRLLDPFLNSVPSNGSALQREKLVDLSIPIGVYEAFTSFFSRLAAS